MNKTYLITVEVTINDNELYLVPNLTDQVGIDLDNVYHDSIVVGVEDVSHVANDEQDDPYEGHDFGDMCDSIKKKDK